MARRSPQPAPGLGEAGDEDEDEDDHRADGHVEPWCGVDAGDVDEPGADERSGSAEDGVGDVVADRRRGETGLRREAFAEEGVAASAVAAQGDDEDRLSEERQSHVSAGDQPECGDRCDWPGGSSRR